MTLLAGALAAAPGPAHPRRHPVARAAAAAGLGAGVGRATSLGLPARCISSGTACLITKASYAAGSINIKTLVTPEWWMLVPLPLAFSLVAHRILLPHASAARQRPRSACATMPSRRRLRPRRVIMSLARSALGWLPCSYGGAVGGSTVLLLIGMPVAISFVAINIVGAMLFLGGEAGLQQVVRNSVAVGDQLRPDADPAVHPDGRGAVPHRPRHQGDRRHRADDPAGAGTPRGGGRRCRHDVLGDLRLDHRHHRHARLADAAGHAGARLSSDAWRPGRSWPSARSTC